MSGGLPLRLLLEQLSEHFEFRVAVESCVLKNGPYRLLVGFGESFAVERERTKCVFLIGRISKGAEQGFDNRASTITFLNLLLSCGRFGWRGIDFLTRTHSRSWLRPNEEQRRTLAVSVGFVQGGTRMSVSPNVGSACSAAVACCGACNDFDTHRKRLSSRFAARVARRAESSEAAERVDGGRPRAWYAGITSRFDCYTKAHPDEPMFVLLARDKMAPALVREWVRQRRAAGEDPEKLANAEATADAMEAWRARSEKLRMWEAHDTPLLARDD